MTSTLFKIWGAVCNLRLLSLKKEQKRKYCPHDMTCCWPEKANCIPQLKKHFLWDIQTSARIVEPALALSKEVAAYLRGLARWHAKWV